jgi:hypothetical protein
MRFSVTMRWQLFGVLTAIAALSGCSCKASHIAQAKGDPNFINPKADPSLSIVGGDGKPAPTGKTVTINFGPTLVNQDKPNQKTLTITNGGVATVTILRLEKSAGFKSDVFKVPAATQVGQAIGPGLSGTINLSYAPSAAGDDASDFTLVTDADDSLVQPLTVHLKGQGVANGCVLTPTDRLDFGNVRINSTFTKKLTVQNTTPIDYDFVYQGITGADAALFTADLNPGPVTIKAHEHLDIKVTFTANHKDLSAAELKFSSPAEMCGPQPFDLRANGVDSLISATPDPVDFGFVDPGVTWGAVSQKVTLTNIGNNAVDLSAPQLCDGVYPGSYQAGSNCAPAGEFSGNPDGSRGLATADQTIHLDPAATRSVTLYFRPARLHTAQGSVQFKTSLTEQADFGFSMKGVGGGPKIQVQPNQLNYGVVAVGAPQARNIVITNVGSSPAGQAGSALHVTSIDVVPGAGTAATEFKIDAPFNAAGGFPIVLAATQRKAVGVRFDPIGQGARSATITVHSDDPVNKTVTVAVQANGQNLPPCNYVVAPSILNFGNVAAGRNRILSFRISNTGATDCYLSNLDLDGNTTNPPFSLVDGPVASKTLAAGAGLDVAVKFAPVSAAPTQSGGIAFSTSSAQAPTGAVQLTGGSAQGCVLITPDDLNFGVVQQGCASREKTFTVYNVCTAPQHVTALGFQADPSGRCPDQGGTHTCPFRITQAPTLPATVTPGQSVTFKVKFQPAAVETDQAQIAVQSQELADPYVVTLQGRGDTTAVQTDTFHQDAQPKVDVLIVVDDSASMISKQQHLASNFQSFIQFAQNQQVDYHIAVTSTSTAASPSGNNCANTDASLGSIAPCGRFSPNDGSRPRVLTSTTPNVEALFGQNVNLGQNGDGLEYGFTAFYEALTAPNITGVNAGFLRDEANLALVIVTDQTGNGENAGPQTYDFYKNFFLNIKGLNRRNLFSFSAVTALSPTAPATTWNCDYDENYQPSAYAQMAQETNGIATEICTDDWATALRQLGQSAFGYRTRFFLTASPDLGFPIDVQLDGVSYPANGPNGSVHWTYDSATSSINFTPLAVPNPGSTLTISYHVQCFPTTP